MHMKQVLTRAINEDLSAYFRTEDRENESIFHIVSGTSIGAINAALLVSYVKENKTGLVEPRRGIMTGLIYN